MRILKSNQSGIVSITVTMIIMILITLIVSSFALIVRREQRQSLDRQLSTQAFYAAETGVSDVIDALGRKNPSGQPLIASEIDDCDTFITETTSAGFSYNSILEKVSSNVGYSCALIDPNPTSQKFTSVEPQDGAFIVPIKTSQNIDTIRIGWHNRDGTNDYVTGDRALNHALPQRAGSTLPTAIARVTIIPGFDGGTLTRDQMANGSQTMFLYPNNGGGPAGTIAYTADRNDPNTQSRREQGAFVDGNCNAGNKNTINTGMACNVDITGLTQREYYLHIKFLYQTSDTNILAFNGTTQLEMSDSQAVIDVTGKAADVLRRISVRRSYGEARDLNQESNNIIPDAALSVRNGICKQLILTETEQRDLCDPTNPGFIPLGDPAPVDPPPGGDPPLGDGDAAIGGVGGTSGGGTGSSGGTPRVQEYRWQLRVVNRSRNDPSKIAGCIWDFGDGRIERNVKCNFGDYFDHKYPIKDLPLDVPADCVRYKSTVTIIYNDGRPNKVSDPPFFADIPQGTKGKLECKGKYRLFVP